MSSTQTRSALSSLITAGTELAVFAACTLVLAGPLLAAARWLVGASGATANFVLNRRWAFRRRDQASRGQASRYAVTALGAVTAATLVWWALVIWTGIDPRFLHVVSMVSVWMTFTYPMMRRWVFAERSERTTPLTTRSLRPRAWLAVAVLVGFLAVHGRMPLGERRTR